MQAEWRRRTSGKEKQAMKGPMGSDQRQMRSRMKWRLLTSPAYVAASAGATDSLENAA
jgi:hypothetical protein